MPKKALNSSLRCPIWRGNLPCYRFSCQGKCPTWKGKLFLMTPTCSQKHSHLIPTLNPSQVPAVAAFARDCRVLSYQILASTSEPKPVDPAIRRRSYHNDSTPFTAQTHFNSCSFQISRLTGKMGAAAFPIPLKHVFLPHPLQFCWFWQLCYKPDEITNQLKNCLLKLKSDAASNFKCSKSAEDGSLASLFRYSFLNWKTNNIQTTVSALHHPHLNLRIKPHHLNKLGCNTKDHLNRGVGETAALE